MPIAITGSDPGEGEVTAAAEEAVVVVTTRLQLPKHLLTPHLLLTKHTARLNRINVDININSSTTDRLVVVVGEEVPEGVRASPSPPRGSGDEVTPVTRIEFGVRLKASGRQERTTSMMKTTTNRCVSCARKIWSFSRSAIAITPEGTFQGDLGVISLWLNVSGDPLQQAVCCSRSISAYSSGQYGLFCPRSATDSIPIPRVEGQGQSYGCLVMIPVT